MPLVPLYTSASSRCAFIQNDGQPQLGTEDASHRKLSHHIRQTKTTRTTMKEAEKHFAHVKKQGKSDNGQDFVNGGVK